MEQKQKPSTDPLQAIIDVKQYLLPKTGPPGLRITKKITKSANLFLKNVIDENSHPLFLGELTVCAFLPRSYQEPPQAYMHSLYFAKMKGNCTNSL